MSTTSHSGWTNWAGNQSATPVSVIHPTSEDELIALVVRAAKVNRRVKVVGAGHSFTDIAATDGTLVMLDKYNAVLDIDTAAYRVTVQSGIVLHDLNHALDRRGLAMPNLGDIDVQTIAGAVSTGTHGTGAGLTGLAGFIVALRLITADGTVLTCSATENAAVFQAARVGLGALGIIASVTLQVCPAFNLSVVNEPLRLDAVLRDLDQHVAANDHFEFFWVPHTGWALTKTNNRTSAAIAPRPRVRATIDDLIMENYAFGALCHVGKRFPSQIPRLAKALPSSGRVAFVDQSFRVFASRRLVRFYEMEYSIPAAACAEALLRVRQFVIDSGLMLNFPVEVRFTAADDIALSTAFGGPRCYIAVHIFKGMDYQPYFRGVEAIMNDYDGRPHWGKLHFQTAATLADRYPSWDAFAAVRDSLDPDRRFTNAYLTRVLGP